MIKHGMVGEERLVELNRLAKEQMQSLIDSAGVRRLTEMKNEN